MGEQLVIKETGALMLWIVICLLAAVGLTIWLLRRPRHAVSSQTSTTGVQSLTIRAQQTIARLEDERTAAELEANVLAAELAYAAHALDCSRLQQMRRESIAVADRWYEQTRTAIAMQREVNTSYQGLKRNVDALYE